MSASVLGLATLLALAGPIDPDAGLPLATAPTPIAGPDVLAHQPGTPTTLFVNFDGAVLQRGCGNDPKHDCSALADIFDGYVGPFTGHDGYKFSILQATRDDVEDFGVRVVIERPDDSVDYAMVLYGDLGEQSF
ncbi:MAG: hypothetical protein KDK70_44680, partial [Myxococcales bacterium]|nr:hypothetical protein [Myxococcales bacterium]